MQTRTIIQAQANVLKITSLVKGNIIKLIEKEYSETYKTSYGVVLDILNSGTKTFIQILKYKQSYSEVSADIVTYAGDQDLTIFPATLDEVKSSFKGVIEGLESTIKDDKKKLQEKIESLKKAEQFVNGELTKSLSEPAYTEMPQAEFDVKKQELLGE